MSHKTEVASSNLSLPLSLGQLLIKKNKKLQKFRLNKKLRSCNLFETNMGNFANMADIKNNAKSLRYM
jgi:hypothetical protein